MRLGYTSELAGACGFTLGSVAGARDQELVDAGPSVEVLGVCGVVL
ncbi:hypothetical protein [Kitasatospora herbaricolor]